MSNLTVTTLSGRATNNNVIGVTPGHTVVQPGMVLQVLQTVKSDTWSAAVGTPTNITGLSVTITPKFSTSKILVMFSVPITTNTTTTAAIRLTRNGSAVGIGDIAGSRQRVTARGAGANAAWMNTVSMEYLDSPSSTSAQTYAVQAFAHTSGYTVFVNRSATDSDGTNGDDARTISTITVMEIAQ